MAVNKTGLMNPTGKASELIKVTVITAQKVLTHDTNTRSHQNEYHMIAM